MYNCRATSTRISQVAALQVYAIQEVSSKGILKCIFRSPKILSNIEN